MSKATRKESTFRIRQQVTAVIRRIGEQFIVHNRLMQLGLMVVGALASAGVAVWVLFVATVPVQPEATNQVQLNTDMIDELELLIDERQRAFENPPNISKQIFE